MKNEDFKIKLILPSYSLEYYKPRFANFTSRYLPYGMGVLTAFLKERKFYVEQEDLSFKFNKKDGESSSPVFKIVKLALLDKMMLHEEKRRFISSGKMKIDGNSASLIDRIIDSSLMKEFNLIGFSIFSFHQLPFALMFARRIKQRTNASIVFGGAYINHYGLLFSSDIFNFVDYIILGDGRIPLLKLINYLQGKTALSEVPNLIYRDNGRLITNPREYYPLEDTPMPDFDGLPVRLYKNPEFQELPGVNNLALPYEISRGCINRCSFCNYGYFNGNRLEFKSYDKVLGELSQMKERYESNTFFFCDDAINNSYEYLEGLCDHFIKNKLYINWGTHARVGNLDRHILMKMRKAGCRGLAFGIESGSNRILESMNKGFTVEQASMTLKDAAEAEIITVVSLVTGYPHETREDINQTIEFIRKNKKYIQGVAVYNFILNYGSPMYFNPEKYGIKNLFLIPRVFSYTFDESDGLKWKQKKKQQKYRRRQIVKEVYNNLASYKGRKFYPLLSDCLMLVSQIIFKIYSKIKSRGKTPFKRRKFNFMNNSNIYRE